MYGITLYIEPNDVLERLSEEDRNRVNQCVFSNVRKGRDGTVEIDCVFFNDQHIEENVEHRYKYCNEGEIVLGNIGDSQNG